MGGEGGFAQGSAHRFALAAGHVSGGLPAHYVQAGVQKAPAQEHRRFPPEPQLINPLNIGVSRKLPHPPCFAQGLLDEGGCDDDDVDEDFMPERKPPVVKLTLNRLQRVVRKFPLPDAPPLLSVPSPHVHSSHLW